MQPPILRKVSISAPNTKTLAGYFDPAKLSSKFTHLRIRISVAAAI